MGRKRIKSRTEWEEEVGYSRAVRVGDRVIVSGTTAAVEASPEDDPEDGGAGRVPTFHGNERDRPTITGVGDPYEQARQAMRNIVHALRAAGAEAKDVVRTRIYVTDIEHWTEIGRAHKEVFGVAEPATSLVEVESLIDDLMVVEVEAEAIVES